MGSSGGEAGGGGGDYIKLECGKLKLTPKKGERKMF